MEEGSPQKEIVNSFREMVELRKERLEIKKSVGVTPTLGRC